MKTLPWFVIPCLAACFAAAAEPVLKIDLGGGLRMELVLIRSGEFIQGSPETEAGRAQDESQRPVRITRDYYIGRTAVTRGQWERFVSETGFRSEAETGTSGGYGWDGSALVQKKPFTWRNPGFPQTADHPVCLVTYPDAEAFCKWLERKTKRATTLPTEAQWEYACRAGSTTPWHSGNSADEIAWHKENAGNGTRAVDSKSANAWGLAMSGNVSEWCLDWYAPYQAGPATDPRQDHPNLSDKARRVLRGGSWLRDAKNTRSAARYRADPRSRNADIGFRVVCSVEVAAPAVAPIPAPPKVEAEPGDAAPPASLPPRESPKSFHRDPPAPGSSFGNPLAGSFGLLVPAGLIIAIIRMVVRSRNTSTNPFVIPPETPAVPRAIRKVDDGFWIHGDWPVGTMLKLRCVIGGVAEVRELIYRPGPEGQFVFTAAAPDSVSVAAGEDPEPGPLQQVAQPSIMTDQSGDRHSSASRPPIFPSAY